MVGFCFSSNENVLFLVLSINDRMKLHKKMKTWRKAFNISLREKIYYFSYYPSLQLKEEAFVMIRIFSKREGS
jgi:hypothetical protein